MILSAPLRRLAVLLLVFAAVPAGAQINLNLGGSADDLLEPEKAFQFAARPLDARSIEVRFAIADGYYMYRDKFRFALAAGSGAKLGTPVLPAGIRKADEFFGEVETYRKEVRIRLPVERNASTAETLELAVTSQGCADLGVCYVPMDSRATIRLAAVSNAGAGAAEPPVLTEAPPSVPIRPRFSIFASDLDIAALFEGNVLLVLASFFGFGVLLTFTPCVLPMIPILSGIIAGEGKRLTKTRALSLSVTYVLGMASAYAAAGVAAAVSGTLLAAALQNPLVLGIFALVFVWLALAMFGLYDIQLPGFLRHRLHAAHGKLAGGRIASVAVMGILSAVVVSPCVAAPLAGALLYISQTKNVMLGGAALFTMALGMGVPLIAVGVSEGALLPKAGPWMEGVKKFFGVLLLGVAIWIVSPVIPVALQMIGWSGLLVGSGVALRAIDPLPANATGWARVGKALGVMLLLAGGAMLIGALAGARDPLRPLATLGTGSYASTPTPWIHVATASQLDEKLRAPGKPVMLEFSAEWCVSCKEMEAFTFSDPRVRAKMDRMLLLRADVTANSEQDKLMLRRYSLFGPPGIIFFDAQGREIRGLRVVGYQDADRFLKTLAQANVP